MNELLMNAKEAWPPYDTVCVGDDMGKLSGLHWYDTFADIAVEDRITFFNKRNRSMAGDWATNLDSKETFPFSFQLYSIGIQFSAPALCSVTDYSRTGGALTDPTPDIHTHNHAIWSGELLKHCSVRLQVSQDEKLLTTGLALPAGYGIAGCFNIDCEETVGNADAAEIQTLGNGSPDFDNRFGFPVPIDIPRGCLVAVELKFSPYAKTLLSRMEGPGSVVVNTNPHNGEDFTFEEATQAGICMIECSLYGPRYVQLRNQQRFI